MFEIGNNSARACPSVVIYVVLGAKCDDLVGCRTIAIIWVHGDVEWAGKKFTSGDEIGIDGRCEAW